MFTTTLKYEMEFVGVCNPSNTHHIFFLLTTDIHTSLEKL